MYSPASFGQAFFRDRILKYYSRELFLLVSDKNIEVNSGAHIPFLARSARHVTAVLEWKYSDYTWWI